MDLLVTGTPGPLLGWTCELVRAVSMSMHDSVELVEPGADEAWAPRTGPNARLVVAGYLGAAHEAAVRDGLLRAVVVVDDAQTSLAALRGSGQSLTEALRNLTACVTPLGRLAGGRHVATVTRDGAAPQAVTRALLEGCRWATDGGQIAALAARIESAWPPPTEAAPEETKLVEQVLEPAFRFAATGNRGMVIWPRACLMWGDRPGEPAPRVLDLTGPSRVLAYGPYFRLAPGRWTARVMLAFSPSCRKAPLAIEMHGSALFARRRFQVPRAGMFWAAVPFDVPSAREAIELRLVSERGAIEGTLGIDHVVLTPDTD